MRLRFPESRLSVSFSGCRRIRQDDDLVICRRPAEYGLKRECAQSGAGGRMVWTKGFGVANAETNEPVTDDSVYEAASLSKVVFAYAVLKLVDVEAMNIFTIFPAN